MPSVESPERLRPWSPAIYRIEVEGMLEESWSDRFAGLRITSRKRADRSIVTCLTGRLMDQCALAGVLDGLKEMHLPILSVEYVFENQEADPTRSDPESIPPHAPGARTPGRAHCEGGHDDE